MSAGTTATHPSPARTLRRDAWWVSPLLVFLGLSAFIVYSTWAAFQNGFYYWDPYLSPFYSPCISANCEHISFPLIGSWWTLSPAFLILGAPGGFRVTCYYYRKAYYRSFFGSPPACAVPDRRGVYVGETRFPLLIQNLHRYFFYLAVVFIVILTWDALKAFNFPEGFGIGVGTVVLWANVALLSLYTFSCHSCRHLCGGGLDVLSKAPVRHRLWRWVSVLNHRHQLFAWLSLFGVGLTDLYVRLVAMGVIHDFHIIF